MTPTVEIVEILRNAPLVSAGAWFLLAILQIARDRWHTWTETFFLAACFFAGLYAFGDWLFFNTDPSNLAGARFAALTGVTSLALAALFLLLFTSVYVDRMKRSYWGYAFVTFVVIVVLWIAGLRGQDMVSPRSPGELWQAHFEFVPFGLFLLNVLVYAALSNRNLYRLYKIVRASSPTLARRAAGLLITFTLSLVLGLITNSLVQVTQRYDFPQPFSTLLGLVAVSAYYTLYPIGRPRISEAIRRFQARRYSIKAVFITYEDGTLIGAKARPGETVIDQDLFGATLDVIQNFMRTSFPILRGKSLSSISHGTYTLVMERARYSYITVVLEGEETDQLRRQMRDLLLEFEAGNARILANWQGIPSEAKGTEEMLSEFFIEAPLI